MNVLFAQINACSNSIKVKERQNLMLGTRLNILRYKNDNPNKVKYFNGVV